MANQAAEQFCRHLFAGCPDYRVDKTTREEAFRLYLEKLSKWRMPAAAWESALDQLLQNNDGSLPELRTIYGYLASASSAVSESREIICATFDLDGKRHALGRDTGKVDPHTHKRIYELAPVVPGNPPALPAGATDPHVVIPPDLQAHYEPCDRDPARGAFLQGWLSSGADGNKCMSMFNAIRKPNETQ